MRDTNEILYSHIETLNKKLRISYIISALFIILNIILIIVYNNKQCVVTNSKPVDTAKSLQETEIVETTENTSSLTETEEIDVCETYEEETHEVIEETQDSVIIGRSVPVYDDSEHNFNVYHIAKVVWAEARGCTKLEQSAVVWCILNRVDAGYGTIYEVITAPNQFAYFSEIEPYRDLLDLVDDVLHRWYREKNGEIDVGRTLPKEYKYFWGDNIHNYFRINIRDQIYWDWSLPNPYE